MDEQTNSEQEQRPFGQADESATRTPPAAVDEAQTEPEIAGRVDDMVIPAELAILPLKDMVIYPFSGVPLAVGQERSMRLINDVIVGNRLVGFVAQKDPEVEGAGPDDTFRVGTVGTIL